MTSVIKASRRAMRNTPPPTSLKRVVDRIVAVVHPAKIVLFGSAARGTMRPHSDLDLLIVVPEGVPRRATAEVVYEALLDVDLESGVDVVVVTEGDIRRHGEDHAYVLAPALADGRLLYAAAG